MREYELTVVNPDLPPMEQHVEIVPDHEAERRAVVLAGVNHMLVIAAEIDSPDGYEVRVGPNGDIDKPFRVDEPEYRCELPEGDIDHDAEDRQAYESERCERPADHFF